MLPLSRQSKIALLFTLFVSLKTLLSHSQFLLLHLRVFSRRRRPFVRRLRELLYNPKWQAYLRCPRCPSLRFFRLPRRTQSKVCAQCFSTVARRLCRPLWIFDFNSHFLLFLCRLFRVLFFAVFECYFIRFSACFACFYAYVLPFSILVHSLLRFASASIASIYPSKPLPEIVLIA